jgi:hypothetical protein
MTIQTKSTTVSTKKLQGAGLAASVAMALAACASTSEPPAASAMTTTTAATVHCKEANSCKGNASCAGVAQGEKHTCKGSNKCASNLREVSKAECDTIKGTVVPGM